MWISRKVIGDDFLFGMKCDDTAKEVGEMILTKLTKAREGKAVKGNKFDTVMMEFKAGKLKSGSGAIVKDRQQALAIASSEAGLSYNKAMQPSALAFLKSKMSKDELIALVKSGSGGELVTAITQKKICYSSAVDSSLYALKNMAMMLTDEEVAAKIETIRSSLSVMTHGEIKTMVFSGLDKLKALKTMDDDTSWKLQDAIRSLIRVTMDLQKSEPDRKFLRPLYKAQLIDKVEGEYIPFVKTKKSNSDRIL
jgi:hypothetical protein